MEEQQDNKVAKGFDRDIDYVKIKDKLLENCDKIYKKLTIETITKSDFRIGLNQLSYTLIALIQLKNGSRISEACEAFRIFVKNKDFKTKAIVKIAKSDGIKFNYKTKQKKKSKARYRKLVFPPWIDDKMINIIKDNPLIIILIKSKRLKKRVLDYLLMYFDCNTHSLRYACINYLINTEKLPLNIVAKFVGHTNVSQLVTYTQTKDCDKKFLI